MTARIRVLAWAAAIVLLSQADCAHAGQAIDAMAQVAKEDVSPALRTFLVLTFMSFIPVVLIGMTSFTRIIVVLSLLRHALGIPQTPPNSVIVDGTKRSPRASISAIAASTGTEGWQTAITWVSGPSSWKMAMRWSM